jgi:hypothetical protein
MRCGQSIIYDENSTEQVDVVNFHRCHCVKIIVDRCGYGSELDNGVGKGEQRERAFELCDECTMELLGEIV